MKVKVTLVPKTKKPESENKKIKINEIPISTEFIKLDSLLKFSAIAGTGGEAKDMIASGEVKVNGETALQRGKKIRPGDRVSALGQEILVTAGPKDVH